MTIQVAFHGKIQTIKSDIIREGRSILYIRMYVYASQRKDKNGQYRNNMLPILVTYFVNNDSYYATALQVGQNIVVYGTLSDIDIDKYQGNISIQTFVTANKIDIINNITEEDDNSSNIQYNIVSSNNMSSDDTDFESMNMNIHISDDEKSPF